MKRLFTTFMLTIIVTVALAASVFAGNTSFSVYNLTNPLGNYTFQGISGTANTKATAQAKWFIRVDDISFTQSTSGTLGMAFTPMKKTLTSYSVVGADTGWAKTSSSSYAYYGWGGNGTANKKYYLGARLDTLLTNCSAQATGVWNSN